MSYSFLVMCRLISALLVSVSPLMFQQRHLSGPGFGCIPAITSRSSTVVDRYLSKEGVFRECDRWR